MAKAFALWVAAFYCGALSYVFEARRDGPATLLSLVVAVVLLLAMFRTRGQQST